LLVDHEDSFVHTLANYLRQTGADVVTTRSGTAFEKFLAESVDSGKFKPDLAVLSPGPGSPSDFKLSTTIDAMIARKVPIFGVCLGLQGLVEHFGGELGILDYPMHGKPSPIQRTYHDSEASISSSSLTDDVLRGLPAEFTVARYHSLHGKMAKMPKELIVTAKSADGIVMAIQHATMPIAAVQFHPESILTLPKNGMKILYNALENLKSSSYPSNAKKTERVG
jgi:anthranilate synthase